MERKHRNLLETARALQFQSKLPIRYWGECILCATYLINRIPLKSIGNPTPYERLHGHKPLFEHLKTFGCLCYVSTSKVDKSNFDMRAKSSVFIGYSSSHKGYKVLDLTTNKITVSRDVTFHETHFPFHHTPSSIPKLTDFPPYIFLPKHTPLIPDPDLFLPFSSIPTTPIPGNHTTDTESSHLDHLSSPFSSLHTTPLSSPTSSSISSSPSHPPPVDNHTQDLIDSSLRKSTRQHRPPAYLNDYHCHHSKHWCNLVSYTSLPATYHPMVSLIASLVEPKTYAEVVHSPEWI